MESLQVPTTGTSVNPGTALRNWRLGINVSADVSAEWEQHVSIFSVPSRDVVLGQINRGVCLSQLIQQLEGFSVTRGEKAPKNTEERCPDFGQKLPSLISKTYPPILNSKRDLRPGSATCCSHLESTSLYGPPWKYTPTLKSNKALGFWPHPPSHRRWFTPHQREVDSSDMAKSETALKITPVLVTRSERLRNGRKGNGQAERAVSSSYCLSDTNYEGLGAGTSSGSSTGHSSSDFMDFPSDDSDLSDQEKVSGTALEWAAPVELNLRLEPFQDLYSSDHLESEDQLPYPEVLPASLKILDLANLANTLDQSLQMQDPSLVAFINRLAEMERMQAATVQKERSKVGRSRPATAITMTRSTSRLRRADFLGSQPENPVTATELVGGCSSALSGFADLVLSQNVMARRRATTARVPSKQSHGTKGSTVNLALPRQSHSSSTKLSRTQTVLSNHDPRDSLLLKAVPSAKVNRSKGSKKVTSRSKRKSLCSARKTTAQPERKLQDCKSH